MRRSRLKGPQKAIRSLYADRESTHMLTPSTAAPSSSRSAPCGPSGVTSVPLARQSVSVGSEGMSLHLTKGILRFTSGGGSRRSVETGTGDSEEKEAGAAGKRLREPLRASLRILHQSTRG